MGILKKIKLNLTVFFFKFFQNEIICSHVLYPEIAWLNGSKIIRIQFLVLHFDDQVPAPVYDL